MIFDFKVFIYAFLLFSIFSYGLSVIMVSIKNIFYMKRLFLTTYDYVIYFMFSIMATWIFYDSHLTELAVVSVIPLPVFILSNKVLKDFYISGRMLLASNLLLTASSLIWGFTFIESLDVSLMTKLLMYSGYPVLVFSVFSGLVTKFEQWEVLCRGKWNRPNSPLPAGRLGRFPKVTIQIPSYSEPPDMVIDTLNAVSKINYPNFEVILIDNNTRDSSLWKPIRDHCRKLGEKFRFIHIMNLKGAKAGALNYANKFLTGDTELIAVMDCDYQPEPNFLECLVGYFEDPKIGFVQTPHDYREWENSLYKRLCYWEYKSFFATVMPSLNERDTALTVGTMCIIRKKALFEAGGWSEWCQTEDSELSIRIHACGYSSVYTTQTFGRGLIPETFEGYKKQRFRWTFGPVQELREHLKLYLPRSLAKPSYLNTKQKIHHLNHGLGYVNIGLSFLLLPVGFITSISMILKNEIIDIPPILVVLTLVGLLSNMLLTLVSYKTHVKCSVKDALGAMFASCALNHTYIKASVISLFCKEIPWHRTNKFKSIPLGFSALGSAQIEFILGMLFLLFAMAVIYSHTEFGIHYGFAAVLFLRSLEYFSAPVISLIADGELKNTYVESQKVKKAVQTI